MNKPMQLAIARTLGTDVREQAAAAPVQPVINDRIDLLKFVEADCGADAVSIERGKVLALRDNGDGTYSTIRSYEFDEFGGKA